MPITALPTPPSRQDPASFAARGDALLSALPVFVTEANALQIDVNEKQAAAAADKLQTGKDRTATGLDRTATGDDRIATGQDRVATGNNRTQTDQDKAAAANSASTAAANSAAAGNSAVTAAGSATAANTALLALGNVLANGIGALQTDVNGELIVSYNSPTVTSMAIDAAGNLMVTYP